MKTLPSRRAAQAGAAGLLLTGLLLCAFPARTADELAVARPEPPPALTPLDMAALGPRTMPVALDSYQHVRYISPATAGWALRTGEPGAPWSSIVEGLNKITDAGPGNRYALIISEGVYKTRDLAMKPHVDLYGGFDPADWTRDIEKHPTILDGGQKGALLLGADNARLDGFILRGARSASPGAALLCRDVSPWITNNVITANTVTGTAGRGSGGAIACIGSKAHPIFEQNIIDYNTTVDGDGGGVAVLQGATARLALNVLAGNVAGLELAPDPQPCRGGAVACIGAGITLEGNLFLNNLAAGGGEGGAVYISGAGQVRIQRNVIAGNNATGDGGGLFARAAGDLLLSANLLAGNNADGSGGAACFASGCAGTFENTLVCNNKALTGGGLAFDGSAMKLTADTICANDAENGGGVAVGSALKPGRGVDMTNGIVFFNDAQPEITTLRSGAIKIGFSILSGTWPGAGNMAVDPMLADDNYHGQVATMQFNARRFQTRLIVVARQLFDPVALRGRVIRVGLKCSIVAANREMDLDDKQEIWVWGDMTAGGLNKPPTAFTILPTYRPLPDSPAVDAGATGGPEEDLYGNTRTDREGRRILADMGALESLPRAELNPAIAAYGARVQ